MSITDPTDAGSEHGTGWAPVHRSMRGLLTANELAVYVALMWRVDARMMCWIRHSRLAEEAGGLSVSTVKRVLVSMRDKGVVTWAPRLNADGGTDCNIYTLCLPSSVAGKSQAEEPPGVSGDGGVGQADLGGGSQGPTEEEPMNENPGTRPPSPPSLAVVSSSPPIGEWFEAWWTHYPRKVGKKAARAAFERAVKNGTEPGTLCRALAEQLPHLRAKDQEFVPYPGTWLNQGRWDDDPGACGPSPDPWAVAAAGEPTLFDPPALRSI